MFRKKIKITILKKLNGEDIFGNKLPITPKYPLICERLEEGKEFIVEDTGAMPEGFCAGAWEDILHKISHLQLDGDFPWFEEKGMAVACCTDAIRPVIFKIERLED